MSAVITFQPVIPQVNAQQVNTPEEIRAVWELMQEHAQWFLGFKNVTLTMARVSKVDISIKTSDKDEPFRTLLSSGDYLLTSDNGYRLITADPDVALGVFKNFPIEFLIPIQGVRAEGSI